MRRNNVPDIIFKEVKTLKAPVLSIEVYKIHKYLS